MRLLVLDESQVLVSVVRRLAPADVQVETAPTFDLAWRLLHRSAPDAVIANLGPSDLPWKALKEYCEAHEPPIPVLFESCVHSSSDEAGLGPLAHSAAFLRKPYPLEELREQIRRLVTVSVEGRGAGRATAPDRGEALQGLPRASAPHRDN